MKGQKMALNELSTHRDRHHGITRRAGILGLVAASSLGAGIATTGAGAAVVLHSGKAAVVVKISASRGGFKKVLTNDAGRTLYTASSCTGACLGAWPPLYMPKGKSVPQGPKGLTGLGTVKVGSHLQVTYKRHRLYTFTADSGTSVSGNGVAGFTVIANA
jgi:predicted lipoprotein with Yx(FWY)xxD motif